MTTSQQDCWSDANPNTNAPCDGIIQDAFAYTGDYSKRARSGTTASWWSATFPAPTIVQTMMLFNVVWYYNRVQYTFFTLGNSTDVT